MTYTSNILSQGKIEGKFYPMQMEEYLKACEELTPAQRDIFYYLKLLDPFGDRSIEIDVIEIANRLKLSKFTVYKSLKALGKLGWLELEKISIRLRLRSVKATNDTSLAPKVYVVAPESNSIVRESNSIVRESNSIVRESNCESLEPMPGIGCGSPHTNKTIKTNKISLSDKKEREKFFEFAMKKAAELPKPPTLPKKWIDTNHDELWAKYQELEQRKETNEQQRMQSIDKQQETVVDPRIAAALENGEILEIDELYKMFRVQEGWWHWRELDQWRAKRSANQPTNEELLRDKQLIAKAANIPI